jgi:hypothetical protein
LSNFESGIKSVYPKARRDLAIAFGLEQTELFPELWEQDKRKLAMAYGIEEEVI